MSIFKIFSGSQKGWNKIRSFSSGSGWQSLPQYSKYLSKVRNKITSTLGRDKDIVVYYYAIGGGSSKMGTENIDIVSPLYATNFKTLLGGEITDGKIFSFKNKVKENLSKIEGFDINNIKFSEDLTNPKYTILSAEFNFLGITRNVKVYYRMDATKEHPSDIEKGYDVLYSRGNPSIIKYMDDKTKKALIGNLNKKSFIVMENLSKYELNFDGFSKIYLGNTEWAGARRLDFLTRAKF